MKIEMPSLMRLSFPDCGVRNFICDPLSRHVAVSMDGAWLADQEIGPGQLNITNWKTFQVMSFEPGEKKWSITSTGAHLKDLCEVEFESEQVVLRGFSTGNGLWTEFKFLEPFVYYETDDRKSFPYRG